nr:ATP-binding cassette domain-containing protein [Actinospica acidiphila]
MPPTPAGSPAAAGSATSRRNPHRGGRGDGPAGLRRGLPGHPDDHAETLLTLGLFTTDRLTARVTDLSTGQRQRLSLARLLTRPSDILLLDEPTNHLSPSLIEDLEQALADYPGTILLVSHDRRLHTHWTGTHLPIPPHAH